MTARVFAITLVVAMGQFQSRATAGECPCDGDVAPPFAAPENPPQPDVDDVIRVQTCYLGVEPLPDCSAADVDCDGAITLCDVGNVLLQFALQTDTCNAFPCGVCCLDEGGCAYEQETLCDGSDGFADEPTFSGVYVGDNLKCTSTPAISDDCLTAAAPGFPMLTDDEARFGVYYENYCATADGASPVTTESGASVDVIGDIWIKDPRIGNWIMIDSGPEFDSVLTAYHDPQNLDQCLCPTTVAEHEAGIAWRCDGTLQQATEDGLLQGPYELGCMMIRIAGNGSGANPRGQGQLSVAGLFEDVFPTPPIVDELNPAKNRFVSFTMEEQGLGVASAIRVRVAAAPGIPDPSAVELWVGPPVDQPDEDSSDPGKTVRVAPLQCEPFYADWSTYGLVHAYGAEIVPGGEYLFATVPEGCCRPDITRCGSAESLGETGKFGDVAPPFDGSGPPEPDFLDIAAVVAKFLADPLAPSKVYTQLQPLVVFPDRPIDFKDVATSVDAFLGVPFVASVGAIPGCACPSMVTCGATACSLDAQCAGGICIEASCRDACGRCAP